MGRKKLKEIEVSSLALNLTLLLTSLESLEETLKSYNTEINELAENEKYLLKVQALTAYRGIEVLSAMKIITEIGDIKRFSHPKKLVSYLGLDIREYSSGGVEKKKGITKMGNTFARTTLVEANQKSSYKPSISQALKTRRKGTPIELISIADKCMKRLYSKSNLLIKREKHKNKVKVACAREMVGFIWESLSKVS